eukprot:1196102-Prorocentrum_minimum.AAC.1
MLYLYLGEWNPRDWDMSEVNDPMYPTSSHLKLGRALICSFYATAVVPRKQERAMREREREQREKERDHREREREGRRQREARKRAAQRQREAEREQNAKEREAAQRERETRGATSRPVVGVGGGASSRHNAAAYDPDEPFFR